MSEDLYRQCSGGRIVGRQGQEKELELGLEECVDLLVNRQRGRERGVISAKGKEAGM